MAARFDTITFLSDYGTGDEFVGVVKSVIRQIAPARHGHRPHPRDPRLRRARRRPHARPRRAVPLPRRGARRGRPRRRHRAAGHRGRGRRRAELPRRPRQRPARRAPWPCAAAPPPPSSSPTPSTSSPRPGPTFAGPRRVRARPPPTSAPACRSPTSGAPIDPLSLLPGPAAAHPGGGRRAPRRGAVGRPLRQLPAQRRPRRGRRLRPARAAPLGRRRPHRRARRHLRGHRARPGRPRRRQLRDAVGLPRQALRQPPSCRLPRRHRGRARPPPSDDDAPTGAPVTLTTKAPP